MSTTGLLPNGGDVAGDPDTARPALQVPERPLPPNPSILALFIVTRSGSGPRIIAHYPPAPSLSTDSGDVTVPDGYLSDEEALTDSGDEDNETHAWSDDNPSTSAKEARSMASNPSKEYYEGGYSFYDTVDDLTSNDSPRKKVTEEEKQSGWDKLFGYSTDSLAKLLAPNSQSWHMNRLEVSMGGRTFVGCPAYRFTDAKWKRPRTPKVGLERHATDSTNAASGRGDNDTQANKQDTETSSGPLIKPYPGDGNESEVPETPDSAAAEKPAFLSTHQEHSPPPELLSSSTPSNYSAASSNSSSSLTMFTVVAVVSPPSLEHQLRVEEHFQFVVKPLCSTLKRLQRRDGYIESQSRMLEKAMGEARERGLSYEEAWQRAASICTLAKTLRTAYDSISASRVAHLSFKTSSVVDVSIQIPLPTSTPFAPTPMTTQIPGLAVSSAVYTASGPATINAPLTTVDSISPHAALLLLHENQDLLAKQLASSPLTSTNGMSGPMSYFVRNVSPRKTLLQLSKLYHVPLNHVQLLAGLLIRWRYARPITPLHTSNAYIVSPNAQWNDLAAAREAFARRFSTLPEMVLILSKLSGTGRTASLVPWSSLIPSSDHKEPYMEMLAWLMRGGWVTQLRTFAWIRISPAVKQSVAEQRHRELDELAKADNLETAVDDSHTDGGADDLSAFGTPQRRPSSGEYGNSGTSGHASGLMPHHLKSHLLPPGRPVSEAGSTGSNRTTFRVTSSGGPQNLHHPDSGHDRRKRSSESHDASARPATAAGSGSMMHRLAKRTSLELLEADANEPTILLEPARLNNVQARWVEHIRQSFADERLRAAWPRLVKYFDGRHALQEIAVMEGWKRKAVTQLLAAVVREGDCLVVVRHW
ncbi:hypothetical protein FH972_022266 [Carpinus fangiana]|uniref:GATOR1 complex protein NPRL3 C-terminal HTH domain-containing protein n=1 Tax=Carpinus fangiana TaxID=176857 RepID=A0A5N6KSA0_9ROSI|nr:hypothetical protein FH972_022266 [Carpinus fangiana]